MEHGWDAASPSLEEVFVQGGKLRGGRDEGREGASRVGEAPVGRCGTSTFDGSAKAGEVQWEAGGSHLPENVGTKPLELILVELKSAPAK